MDGKQKHIFTTTNSTSASTMNTRRLFPNCVQQLQLRHLNYFSTKTYILCYLVIFAPILTSSQPTQPTTPESHKPHINQLVQLGYLSPTADTDSVDIKELEEAIELYQTYHGLPTTGKFDDATKLQMSKPRCGNPDKTTGTDNRGRRYAVTSGWGRPHLTWNVVNYTQDLTTEQVDDAIERAFKLWSDDTVLTFERVYGVGDEVDIQIDFSKPYIDHGDGILFDGPGQVLAHAFLPWFSKLKGDVHFDDGETWTHDSFSGANLWLVAAHEIGHSLGLQHSFVQGSLMYPYHTGYRPNFTLPQDDRDGIIVMYGDGTDDFVTQKPGPPNNPQVPRLCRESFDAIDVASDGFTYVYKGDYYWRLFRGQILEGYPKLISQGWPGLQSNIDAALTVKNALLWQENVGKTFFFKGRAVWRYNGRSLDPGYPKDISTAFYGFPNHINRLTAAVEINGNGQTFLVSDELFFMYSHRQLVEGPYSVNTFRNIPANIADVVQLQDNYIYFFTDDLRYFQVSPWTLTPSYGYPKPTTDDWFACESTIGFLRNIGTEPPGSDDDSNSSNLPPFCNLFMILTLLIISLMQLL